jgi:hypothetical protein
MSPTPKIAAAATTTPSGSEEPTKMCGKWWTPAATIIATRNPRNIAGPPP